MISDIYQDTTAEMLTELGYEASFMEDLNGGEEIVIMEKDFSIPGETLDKIEFLSILPGSVKKTKFDEGGLLVRFIARTERGATKPMSFGGSWGMYKKI